MTVNNKILKRKNIRTKALAFLLVAIIFPLIFNTPLFTMFNKYDDNVYNEKYPDRENPFPSSNHPNNAYDYKFYKEITIDHTQVSGAANIIDFPVLISILDSDLHDKAQSDADDIAFAIDFEWLDHEIELFNQNYNSTHAQLVAWVRVPILSPSVDTVIHMYYGNPYIDSRENPKGVWNDDYLGVWHLSESSGNAQDSTSYETDGTPSGGISQGVSGQIGNSYQFDRDTTGTVNMGDPADGHLDFGDTDDFTIECWLYLDYFYYYDASIISKRTGLSQSSTGYAMLVTDDNNGYARYDFSDGWDMYQVDGSTDLLDSGWRHVVYVFDQDNDTSSTIYIDGNDDKFSSSGTISSMGSLANSANFRLNGRSSPSESYMFDGKLDEVHVLNVARSADWVKTEYNNQFNPGSFCNISTEIKYFIPSIKDFEYFKEITIDHTKVSGISNLINFPLLISIFDSDLHDFVQPDGDDIAFNNGTSWLFHEIELFNQNYNSTHAQLVAWIQIPVLSPSEDIIIRMYFGNSTMNALENPQRVWDSNYKGVWHLSETGSGTRYDSTSNSNDGTPIGYEGDETTTGKVDGADDLDGIDDTVLINDNDSLDMNDSVTLEVWIKPNILGDQLRYVAKRRQNAPVVSDYDLRHSFSGNNIDFLYYDSADIGNIYRTTNAGLVIGTWYHVVATYDGTTCKIYRNGELLSGGWVSGGSGSMVGRDGDVAIGRAGTSPFNHFEGKIDEVRISSTIRLANWIETEYNNQYDPSSFYSVGNAIKVDEDAPSDASFFNHYKVIKIDSLLVYGSGYHSNFPVLISLFDSDLHSDVQVDGDDIAFALGSNWLDHEIEVFNQNYNVTHAQLVAWVRIPELSTSLDTYIRMYYGNFTMNSRQNPTGVWDGIYKGVWHFSEDPMGVIYDSTSNNNDGISVGGMNSGDQMTGQIDGSLDFDGDDDTIKITDGTSNLEEIMKGNKNFTISCWMMPDVGYQPDDTFFPIFLYSNHIGGDENTIVYHSSWGTETILVDVENSYQNDYIETEDLDIEADTWYFVVLIGLIESSTILNITTYLDGDLITSQDIDRDDFTQLPADIEIGGWGGWWGLDGFDGQLDESRMSNITHSAGWIKTEYLNQYYPNSFYSIGPEQGIAKILYSNLQVNALDLYRNPISFANISIYNQTTLIRSNLTDTSGTTLFMNIIQGEYNFTASITSDIGNHIELVNITAEAIVINQSSQIINLICDVSSNFFEIVDIDGVFVDSGWIIVGNSTHELQNCLIDGSGHAQFWWVNTMPYEYNYTVYYQDNKYNPNIIQVASGNITTANASIQVQARLTTVNFNIQTLISKQPVSGVKLLLTATNTGESIVNLTTDKDGKATLRWLNSTGINGNYSLRLEFFGTSRLFNMTGITKTLVTETNFTVSATEEFLIYIEVSLENYETELISLSPTKYISVKWGSQLNLRTLFNVSKAIGAEHLLGPTYSDLMIYQIFRGADLIESGNFDNDIDYIGSHYSSINTKQLESDMTYLIFVSAQKSGYSIPQDLLLQLNILKNDLILNQSQNNDSIPSVYWSDNIDFSVKAYGELSESFTTETSIFQSIDHTFMFYLPNVNTHWNLSQITFNIYNISWNVNASDINLSIIDPYGVNRIFNTSNHAGWDYNLGLWTGITINLNRESPTHDNNFEFFISGTFDSTIDVIAHASFIRNGINAQYVKFNVSNTISLISESEGWAIKNITFIIQNCYNTLTWQKVNLSSLTNLNISTADGFKYSLHSGDINGTGNLIIDDLIIYPQDNQYRFIVESNPNIIFDAIITVEYIQYFYQNQYLETLNISHVQQNIPNGGNYQLSLIDSNWDENYAVLLINGIKNGSQYFYPSQVAMNITIEGQKSKVSNTLLGQGTFSLRNLNKDTLYTAIIETNQPVNFTLSFKIGYSRTVVYETLGTITYIIRESPDVHGAVAYYTDLQYYLQSIDTSLLDADHYTIRFELTKRNYNSATKDFDFVVMNRLTLINGESTISKVIEFMYVKDAINFTFLYTDAFTGARITDLNTQYYMWERYDPYGNVTANGEGSLIQVYDNSLVLDFDSETRTIGEYLLILTFEKDNFEYKNAMIRLTIKKRELDYSLSDNFKNYQTNIVQGKMVHIRLNLTDPTQGANPLLNATVIITINDIDYSFEELGNGTYLLELPTANVNAFFTSKTLTGIINITRENYISEEFRIIIVIEMEQIFPGMPTFYFLIIIFAILATAGSIVGYRIYKYVTIPTFVKNVREIKKEIKNGKSISETFLYHEKEVFVGEIVRDKWSTIGLSLGDILGIDIKKSKKSLKTRQMKTEKSHDLKPLGLLLMKWDERIGAELLVKYPKIMDISDKTLMQIYGTHEYSGEKGIINLTFGSMNILSYYTGPELSYYIILILNLDDDPDMYEAAMPNIAHIILQNLEDNAYFPMIPSLFQRLSVYPSLTDEQNLIFSYQDSIKRMIINILRDYGVITKSELLIWVKERELEGIIDLEAVLADLIKSELIKVASVKGIPSELIFLIKDIFTLRVPPDKLFKDPINYGLPAQFKKEYQDGVKKSFHEYHPTEEDTLKMLDSLIDPEVYETVRLLRNAIVTMKDFEKLKSKGVSDIYGVLKKLYDTNMIKVFKNEDKVEYYALLTDFYIDFIFPKYLLKVIKVLNDQKSKSDKVLIQYLNILEEAYYNLK